MDEELISKKELLDISGISYGALYRYKRKNLIPDEWFIRKSTFTGQETFFPRDKILRRIEQIQSLKEEISLDSMAEVLSSSVSKDFSIKREDLFNQISDPMKDILSKYENINIFNIVNALAVIVSEEILKTGKIAKSECENILETLLSFRIPQKNDHLICYRSNGAFFCIIASSEVFTNSNVHLILDINLEEKISNLKYLFREEIPCQV